MKRKHGNQFVTFLHVKPIMWKCLKSLWITKGLQKEHQTQNDSVLLVVKEYTTEIYSVMRDVVLKFSVESTTLAD